MTTAPTYHSGYTAPRPSLWQKILSKQPFWVMVAVVIIPLIMTVIEPSFRSAFSVARTSSTTPAISPSLPSWPWARWR